MNSTKKEKWTRREFPTESHLLLAEGTANLVLAKVRADFAAL